MKSHFQSYRSPFAFRGVAVPSRDAVLNLEGWNYSGSGAWIDTVLGRSATRVGSPSYVGSLYFDLDGGSSTGPGVRDSFSISSAAELHPSAALSVAMWVRLDTVQGFGSPNLLFDKRESAGVGYVGFFTGSGYTFRVGTTSASAFTVSVVPALGVWQHLVFTLGSSSTLYRDGGVLGSSSYGGDFSSVVSSTALQLGDISIPATGVYALDGELGGFSLYDVELSAAEVLALYEANRVRFGL